MSSKLNLKTKKHAFFQTAETTNFIHVTTKKNTFHIEDSFFLGMSILDYIGIETKNVYASWTST